ncbi:MAG TPA: nucleotidyltransferase family protein, partial [Candidatus Binataceae bacterium]|nr:nucleotidyltransferase family protein [Candidatus Binataceae bacterium]
SNNDLAHLDWTRLLQMAAEHAVQPLIYLRLRHQEGLPPAVLKAMRAQYYASSLSNLKLARELVRLTALLDEAGIPALAFKGPVLALKLRGDLSLRQFNDLDLLVRPEDAGRAAELLIRENHYPRHFDPANVARSLRRCNEDEFIRPHDLQMIDLHWALGPHYFPYGPAAELVWQRAIACHLEGGEVLTMGGLDTVLYLAVHGTKHGWAMLGAVCDLAAAFGPAQAIDPHQLLAEAARCGCLNMVLLGAILARNLLGATLPSPIADRIIRQPGLNALAAGIERRMFKYAGLRSGLYLDWFVSLRLLQDSRSRLRYFANRAFLPAPEDVEFIELPAVLYLLYFPLRPFRLLLQHGKRLFIDVPIARKRVKRISL